MLNFPRRPEIKVLASCLIGLALSLPAYHYHADIQLELAGILFLAVALDPWWAAVGGLLLATLQGLTLNIDYFYYISLYVILGLYWGYAARLGTARIFGPASADAGHNKRRAYLIFCGLFVLPSMFIYAGLKTVLQLLMFRNPGQDYSDKLFYFYFNYLVNGQIIPEIWRALILSLPFMLALVIGGIYLIARHFPTPYAMFGTKTDTEDLVVNRRPVIWYLAGHTLSLIVFLCLEYRLAPTAQLKLQNLIPSAFFWEIPLLVIGVLAYLMVTEKSNAGYVFTIFITMLPPTLIIWMILRLESEMNISLRNSIYRGMAEGRILQPQLANILDLHMRKQTWLIGLVTAGIFAGTGIVLLILYSWNKDIRAAKAELEQKVIERTRKLAQAQEQLIQAEKLAILGRLAAEVAHEVNNPLYGVINYADIAAGKNRENPALRHYLGLIRSGLYYISAILKQLGSIPANHDPKFLPVDIAQVLDQALFLMDYKITTQKIQIVKQYKPELFKIEADPQLLQQVFINLIHNALQAMKESGKLTMEIDWLGQDRVQIKFTDTGQGIPPEHMENIFKPFFTTKKAVEGMGLGLTVCENFVKKHNGSISVQSKTGDGTTFVIELPVRH